jgi:hypothetical protein
MARNILDTDTNLAANTDGKAASQKAVKAYVDARTVDVTVASGEKALTVTSAGVQKNYDVTDMTVAATSLTAADWSAGTVTLTGITNQTAYDSNYMYVCVGTNTWRRAPINLSKADLYLGTIDDSGGLKTSTQLTSAFPSVVTCQRVYGTAGIYEKKASNWVYFAHTTV